MLRSYDEYEDILENTAIKVYSLKEIAAEAEIFSPCWAKQSVNRGVLMQRGAGFPRFEGNGWRVRKDQASPKREETQGVGRLTTSLPSSNSSTPSIAPIIDSLLAPYSTLNSRRVSVSFILAERGLATRVDGEVMRGKNQSAGLRVAAKYRGIVLLRVFFRNVA